MAPEEDPTLEFDDDGDQPTHGSPDSDGGRTQPTQPSRDDELAPTLPAPAVPARPGKERGVVTGTGLGPDGTPARPAVDPAAGKVIADRFEVTATLGEGGMGKVFRARDRHIDGREVALKVLRSRFSKNKRFIELFRKEIRAAQEFVSEHVNQVRDTGQLENGSLFLTMDLVHGQTLGDILKREEMLNERHALEVARQVLLGLQSGHEKGFVHRDVKPGNVMLESRVPKTDDNPFGVKVHLLDFGIAGLAAEIEENQVAGTPHYMSPEQIQGQRLDPRSDLFAVGVVLYEMIAGVRPFRGKTLERITTSVMETDVGELVAKLEHLSKPVQQLLSKALQKDRKKRYQSAADFIDAIEASEAYKVPRASSPLLVAAVVLFLLTTAAGAFGFWWQQDRYNQYLATVPENAAEEIKQLRRNLGSVESQLESKRQDYDSLQDVVAARDLTISTLNTTIGGLRQELSSAELEIAGKKTLAQRITDLETAQGRAHDEELRLRGQIDTLREQLGKQQDLGDPNRLMARHFDAILEHCSAGDIRSAVQAAEVLDQDRQILQGSVVGKHLLIDLVGILGELESFELAARGTATPELVRQLDKQAAALTSRFATIENQVGTYPKLAEQWFDYQDDESEEVPGRGAVLSGFVSGEGGIAARVAHAEDLRAQVQESAWKQIAAGDQGVDPGALLESSDLWGEERIQEFVEGRARELLSIAMGSGPAIDADSLEPLLELDQWHALLTGDHRSLQNTDSGRDLLLLSLARGWYTQGKVADPLPLGSGDIAGQDWRKLLLMQMELASSNSPFPTRSGQRALYRETRDSSSLVLWRRHNGKAAAGGGPDRAWTMDQDIGRGEGNDFSWVSNSEEGNRIEYTEQDLTIVDRKNGTVVLPLGDPSVGFERIEPDRTTSTPGGIPSPFELETYRKALPEGPLDCLVVESGEFTRWFSPSLGLVREVHRTGGGTTITRELLFASHLR